MRFKSAHTHFRLTLYCCAILLSLPLYSQTNLQPSNFSGGDVFGTRVFIENKGQFSGNLHNADTIEYGYQHNAEFFYFNTSGIFYDLVSPHVFNERDLERMEKGKKPQGKGDQHVPVRLQWCGATLSNITIEPGGKQAHHMTYGSEKLNAPVYKTLLYKNVYPSTDIEISLPENHDKGFKYTILLHPGADVSKIKLLYSGQTKHPKKLKDGGIKLECGTVDLLEEAPISFYADGEKINSAFELRGDTVCFVLDKHVDTSKEISIDPFVVTTSNFMFSNLVYDIDYDYAGNCFIFGSNAPAKVAMYNSAGQLQWTFGGSIPAINWSTQPGGNNDYLGNFVVDKFSGKTYISFALPNPRVVRLTLQGNYDNFITAADPLFQELWEMSFHCSSGNILLLGGGHSSNLSAAQINPNTASVTLSTFNPGVASFVHDISAFTQDAQGNAFAYYATSNTTLNQKITKVNSTYNGNVWTVPSGYNVLAEANNKSVFANNTLQSAGYNGLCANTNYLFYYDGVNVAAYSKTTGSLVASFSLLGSGTKANGGIAADDCNHIYIGRIGGLACYEFTGSQFNTLAPISYPTNYTAQKTFDVKYNPATNVLYFAGAGFCGTALAPYSGTCSPNFGTCVFSQQLQMTISSSLSCSSLGSATAMVNSPQGNYSYLWLPGNLSGAVINSISPGVYTVIATNISTNQSYTITSLLTASGNFSANTSYTLGNPCSSSNNNTLAVTSMVGGSGQYGYTWYTTTGTYSTPSIANMPLGTYTLAVTDLVSNCSYVKVLALSMPPPLILYVNTSSLTVCVNSTVQVTVTANGGIGPYTYQWATPSTGSTAIVTSTVPGTNFFGVSVTDSLGCVATTSIAIYFQANTPIAVTNATVCPNTTATIACAGAPNYYWNGMAGSYIHTLTPAQTTTVEFSSYIGTCIARVISTITVLPGPTLSINSPYDICIGKPWGLAGSGANSLSWQGPNNFSVNTSSFNYSVSTYSQTGIYTLKGVMNNGCTQTQSVIVTVHANPTVTASGGNYCTNQTMVLSASTSNATFFQWYGPNNFSSQLSNPTVNLPLPSANGNYTVNVSSAFGCTNSAVTSVSITSPIAFSLSANSPVCQYQSLQLQSSSAPASANFSWNGPNGFSSQAANPSIPGCGMANAGLYTLTISYGPCYSSQLISVTVYPAPQFIAQSNGTLCTQEDIQLTAIAAFDQNIQSYLWTGPLGFSCSQSATTIVNATPANGGNYSITAVNNLGCPHSSIVTVPVFPLPNVTAVNDTTCLNANALLIALGAPSYTWYSADAALNTGPYLNFTNASPVQVSTFTVIGSSVEGCTNAAVAQLVVNPNPTVTAQSEQTKVCQFSNFTLSAAGAQTYQWLGGNINGQSGPIQLHPADYQAGPLEFTVRGSNKYGCTANATASLVILALPQATIVGGPFLDCVPFCGNYKVSTNSALKSLEWQFDKSRNALATQYHCFNVAGTHTATIFYTDANTCSNTSTAIIVAAPKPIAQFKLSTEKPQALVDEVQINDMSQGKTITTWQWSVYESATGLIQTLNDRQPEQLRFEKSGNYAVALEIVTDQGCKDTLVRSLQVQEPFLIYVPNAFTPNTDVSNDIFIPVMSGVKEYSFQIFNRWGQEIFASTDPVQGWDGSYKGSACQQGEYTWKLRAKNESGEQKELIGTVLLYR